MSEQILSQEEVGALLSAMDKGEVDLQADPSANPVVENYGLNSKKITLHDRFGALDEVYDTYKMSLQKSLSSLLQRSVEVEFVSSEISRFSDFLEPFDNPTSLNVFTMEPLIGSALLAIGGDLVFSLIDCMCGGKGKPLPQLREFTLIEQRMIRKLVGEMLKNLETAWRCIYPLKVSLTGSKTNPEFIRLYDSNDSVLHIIFSINGQEFSGNIHLCLSYLMLEPMKDKVASKYLEKGESAGAWSSELEELLRKTHVEVTAELGRTISYTVRDLLELERGDIIRLSTGPQDSVMVRVEGVAKYHGFPGVVKGNRAIQISELCHENGGLNRNGWRDG
jgi:flagellar motor switch protein FliM